MKNFKKSRVVVVTNIIILSLLFNACNKETKKGTVLKKSKYEYQDSVFGYRFDFPDTILINKTYDGKLIYNSIFDTITTKLTDKTNGRIIVFSLAKANKINSLDDLKRIAIDTFDAEDVHTIPFKNIKFTKPGTFYIDGIISDNVIIDTNKVKSDLNEVRYLVKEFRATHKIIVVPKP